MKHSISARSAWESTLDTIASTEPRPRPRVWVANPKPAGRYCEGGASDAVLQWLDTRLSSRAWWSLSQIIEGTGRSAKACSWAVLFLARNGYIDRDRGVNNSRYLRYRSRRQQHP